MMPKGKIIHKCPVSSCSYSSNRIQNVNRHARAFHCPSSKIQNCCGTYFLSLHDYTEHRKAYHVVSNGITSYKCQICGLNTNSKSAHEKHLRIHTKIHPYKCSYCNYSSPQRSNVMRHLPKHFKKEGVTAFCITDLPPPGTEPAAPSSTPQTFPLPPNSNGLTFSMSWREDIQSESLGNSVVTMDPSLMPDQSTSSSQGFSFSGFPKNNIQDFIDNFIPTVGNIPQSSNEIFPDLDETLSAYEGGTCGSSSMEQSSINILPSSGESMVPEEKVKIESYDFNGFLENEEGASVMVKLENMDHKSVLLDTKKSSRSVSATVTSSWQPTDQQTADDMLNDLMEEIDTNRNSSSTSSTAWDHILSELHPSTPTAYSGESSCNLDLTTTPLATSTPIKSDPSFKLNENQSHSEWTHNQQFQTISIPDTYPVDPSSLPKLQVETNNGESATYIEL